MIADIGNYFSTGELAVVINIIFILAIHFVADFMMQTDDMARGKSTSNKWLLAHVSLYMLPFAVLVGPMYAIVNGISHFVTDYVTSRWATKLWNKGEVHNFFVVVGLDQLLHGVTLITTYYWMYLL